MNLVYYKMATAIIASSMASEERRRQEEKKRIVIFKKREQQTILTASNSMTSQISYGVMWYHTYYLQGVLLSNYKIHFTSTNMDEVFTYIKEKIIEYIKKKIDSNLLFYKVDNIDPRVVSYHLITSSNFSFLKIIISKKVDICTFQGNQEFCNKLYGILDFLEEYDVYKDKVKKLNKHKLKDLYYELYGSRPLLMKKKSMFKAIMKHQKLLIQ